MKIVKNDTVLVMSGKDKGKKGQVRRVHPDKETLIVDGVNMVRRHARARAAARQAGIIELEAPLHISKVMLICNKCNRPTRVAHRFLEDRKVRVCLSCHEVLD
ncbi:MAG: 50S ribosomal protein L24 [Chloroflexi bacterium RBG_13_54_8]|nr:MAG: 50S ribosomal protein L24 [Chloroflexi bacterium RBG_13_54_8]